MTFSILENIIELQRFSKIENRGDNVNRIRRLREQRKLRQQDMADILGMSVSTYSKKENGDLRFSLKDAKVISDYFHESMESLFFTDDISKMENTNPANIIPRKDGEINVTKPHESCR